MGYKLELDIMAKMTDEEIIALYIEKRAFQQTIAEMGKNGGRFEVGLDGFCRSLEKKIDEIDAKFNTDNERVHQILWPYRNVCFWKGML